MADAIGGASYAARIAGEARAFRHPRSPLERALNRLLLTLVAIIAPLGVILGVALWERRTPLVEAVPISVAAVVTLVPAATIPFSSRRRFGAVQRDGRWVLLGAPELFSLGGLAAVVGREADAGRRVVALGTSANGSSAEGSPRDARVRGLAVLTERLRPEARATVEFFRRQGVELKVLSGDRPETVGAVAADVGIPADRVVDGRELPETQAELAALLETTSVIGRISPESKRRVVEALRDDGRYVAMVGDGVNDVPALKAARLAIAQGTGTQMARSVADVVLVNGDFGAVPAMVAEGRKILRNLQRVTKLFVTKSAFAAALIVSIGLTPTAYPLLPRHLTLAATLTIGVPSFFLALAPSSGRYQIEGFLREVSSFSVPAGTAAGLGVLSSYLFALNVLDLPLVEARTVATTVLVTVGLYLIVALEASGRRRGPAVSALCLVLASLYVLTLSVPFSREFFALAAPGPVVFATALAGATLAIAGLAITSEKFLPGSR